jgi:hypothetical protein
MHQLHSIDVCNLPPLDRENLQKTVEKLERRALTSPFCMQPVSFCMSNWISLDATPAFSVPEPDAVCRR